MNENPESQRLWEKYISLCSTRGSKSSDIDRAFDDYRKYKFSHPDKDAWQDQNRKELPQTDGQSGDRQG